MFNSITHHGIFVLDQDEALDFYVGKLGLEVAADVDMGFMRWLTVTVPGSGREILLEKPGPPAHSDDAAARVRELVSQGAMGLALILTTDDARKTYAELEAQGVEMTQEPIEQDWGIDFGLRDPFGNHLRVSQPPAVNGS